MNLILINLQQSSRAERAHRTTQKSVEFGVGERTTSYFLPSSALLQVQLFTTLNGFGTDLNSPSLPENRAHVGFD